MYKPYAIALINAAKYFPHLIVAIDFTVWIITLKMFKIINIVKSYPGKSPVIIKCTGTNKSFKLSYQINPNNYLLNELNDNHIKLANIVLDKLSHHLDDDHFISNSIMIRCNDTLRNILKSYYDKR